MHVGSRVRQRVFVSLLHPAEGISGRRCPGWGHSQREFPETANVWGHAEEDVPVAWASRNVPELAGMASVPGPLALKRTGELSVGQRESRRRPAATLCGRGGCVALRASGAQSGGFTDTVMLMGKLGLNPGHPAGGPEGHSGAFRR